MRTLFLILTGLLAASLSWAATPPLIVCPPAATLECSNGVTAVEVTVSDADGDALMVVWMVNGESVLTNVVASGVTTNGVTISLTNSFAMGTNEVLVGVTDDGTNVVSCSTLITIADTTPPVIELVTASPTLLWPPNHKFRHIPVRVVARDDCSPVTWQITSVESNEPADGRGDGNTSPDWIITRTNMVRLRAERSGGGNGRVYTIHVQAVDGSTNAVESSVNVFVPHDRGRGKPLPVPPRDDGSSQPKGKGKGKGKGKK